MTQGTGDEVTATSGDQASWREQAVARSLGSARARAEQRVQRFLDAALELIHEGDGSEFTVQEVVDRSGQSLRSFYMYFGGKHELLLALFEEAIRSTADHLQAVIADETDPQARLRRFLVEYYKLCTPPAKGERRRSKRASSAPVLMEFAQQLLTSHPTEAAQAFVPVVTLFRQLLDDAASAGVIRADLEVDFDRLAGTILESVMFHTFSSTIAGIGVETDATRGGDGLWNLYLRGLAPVGS